MTQSPNGPAPDGRAPGPLTDEALALLLAESDRLGDEMFSADRFARAQSETMCELCTPARAALPYGLVPGTRSMPDPEGGPPLPSRAEELPRTRHGHGQRGGTP